MRIGNLTFECVDFGEVLKLNTALQKKMNVGGRCIIGEMRDTGTRIRSGMGSPGTAEALPV